MNVYCDRITCDYNHNGECELDMIHIDDDGGCCEIIDNPYKDGVDDE